MVKVKSIGLRCVCYWLCHAFAMRLPSLCRPVCSRLASLVLQRLPLGQLGFDPLVTPHPAINDEEPRQRWPEVAPLLGACPADTGQRPVIVGQGLTVAPIGEYQQQVSAMLQRVQVHGVSEVIADVDRHPCIGARAAHACHQSSLACAVASMTRPLPTDRLAWGKFALWITAFCASTPRHANSTTFGSVVVASQR